MFQITTIDISNPPVIDNAVDYTVIGNTVNIASRLESGVAKPGEVIVSEYVRKQTKKKFNFKLLGEITLHGISKPVKAYSVLGKKKETK